MLTFRCFRWLLNFNKTTSISSLTHRAGDWSCFSSTADDWTWKTASSLITNVCTLLTKPHLCTDNSTSWDQHREGGPSDLFDRFIRFLCSLFISFPSLFLAFLCLRWQSYDLPGCLIGLAPVPVPRYICHSTHAHTDINTQYNAHAGLFCEANFIATPLGLPYYHSPTELWYVRQGLAAVCEHVWTSVVQICQTKKEKTLVIKEEQMLNERY